MVVGDGKYQPAWGDRGRKERAGGSCNVLTGTEALVGPQRPLVEMPVANSLERPRVARWPASEGVRLGKTVPAPPGRGRGRERLHAQHQAPHQRESVCGCSSG